MTSQTRKISPIRLIIGIGLLLMMGAGFLLGVYLFSGMNTQAGTAFTIPRAIKNIELTRHTGDPITVNDLRGKYTLMSFGYTHCPDVCPLTLTEYRRVKRELTENEVNRVQFAFVSVDGERDTPELLNRYITRFDENFIAITSADDTIMQQFTDGFKVFYQKREVEGTQASYLVDHTATLFLLGPRGNVVNLYPFGTPATEIAQDIKDRL